MGNRFEILAWLPYNVTHDPEHPEGVTRYHNVPVWQGESLLRALFSALRYWRRSGVPTTLVMR